MTLVFVPFTKVTLRGGEETAWAANTRQSVHAPNGYLLLCITACISAVILATYIWALQLPKVSVYYYTSQLKFHCSVQGSGAIRFISTHVAAELHAYKWSTEHSITKPPSHNNHKKKQN